VIAEVDSLQGVKSLLNDLAGASLPVEKPGEPVHVLPPSAAKSQPDADDPASRVETKASLAPGSLAKTKLVAFKENAPQLLRPNTFENVTDALLVLLFAVETGLRTSKIPYDSFKGLFEAQNIKSGTPMRILLSNLRNAGYLDKTAYASEKTLSLTAKGETKAIEVLQQQCK
jgi:hypothetical protein